jgi:hypothetical protein
MKGKDFVSNVNKAPDSDWKIGSTFFPLLINISSLSSSSSSSSSAWLYSFMCLPSSVSVTIPSTHSPHLQLHLL